MAFGKPQHSDASEDGHPCEAALEFRRAAIRFGVAEEIGADALDLAVSFAWIGKAVSRTAEAWSWISAGSDPNTWLMIRAMARDPEARSIALKAALSGNPAPGFESGLAAIRESRGFSGAALAVGRTLGDKAVAAERKRLAELEAVAKRLPGPEDVRPMKLPGNVVALRDFRKRPSGRS